MSQQQRYSEYLYFTIHQDSDQSAQNFIQKYQFDKMYGSLEYWDKNQLNDEQTHQFDKMCVRFNIGDVENTLDMTQQCFLWLNHLKRVTKIQDLSKDYDCTLHLVTHGANFQDAGFHLSHSLLRELSSLSIGFHLHSFLDNDDFQDYPFSHQVSLSEPNNKISEYAYFWMESNQLTAQQLQDLLPNLVFKVDFDQGKKANSTHKKLCDNRSSISLKSQLCHESYNLEQHLSELISQLLPYRDQLQSLFFNSELSFGINVTGYLENPHHKTIDAKLLLSLFSLGINLDVDYYFA